MRVTPPDLALWLIDYVRARAADEELEVDLDNKEPVNLAIPLPKPLIIIRDDSGRRLDWTTFDRSIGASVLAGTRMDDKPAIDLANWLGSVLWDEELVLASESPIAAVVWDGSNGPYAVPDQLDVARQYLTAGYVVTGSWSQPTN